MKTVLDILKLSTDFLQHKGISNPRRQAEDLIGDILNIGRMQLYVEFDRPLTDLELDQCRTKLARRAKGEPLQYIKGDVQFYNCLIKVTPAVLIPRQETEILVDKIAKQLAGQPLQNKTLWDLCCGSGCIGIALKKQFPELNVVLSDLSSEALALAQENARLNKVEVSFLKGDLLAPFYGQKTDFFVCNPPYIAADELPLLDVEVRDYEPHQALIAGTSGLEFYQRLALALKDVLNAHAKVWFELGKGQGEMVREMFLEAPWKSSRVEQDWSGHDRFFFLEIE